MFENSEISAYAWLQFFDTLDSTNNYAMELIQDGMAQHGAVIMANFQSQGKGQRGKQWLTKPGDNIAMSLILGDYSIGNIYHLSFLVPCAVHHVLQQYMPTCQVAIKWPNDIYVHDKKLVGILIENIFRGMQIAWSVIGIGVNLNQAKFDEHLPNAISVFQLLQSSTPPLPIVVAIRNQILQMLSLPIPTLAKYYNQHLWKQGSTHTFIDNATQQHFNAYITGVNEQFELLLGMQDGTELKKIHGSVQW